MHKLTLSVTMLFACALSACGTAPERPPYDGSDLVGEIDPNLLVGNWKITVLNPLGDENSNSMTQKFKQNGTWESIVIPSAEQTAQLGPLQYEAYGEWLIKGDSLVSNLDGMEETTGNKLGSLMQAVVTTFMPKSSTANVYELTDTRIIYVHEETGQATLLERI